MNIKTAVLTASILMISSISVIAAGGGGGERSFDAAPLEGNCGENLTWSFDTSTGELTISGSGEMDDYGGFIFVELSPWDFLKGDIRSVTIGAGVTSIGNHAFRECTVLTTISIPEDVTDIGAYAFSGCSLLASVTIFGDIDLSLSAFIDCDGLSSIEILGDGDITNNLVTLVLSGIRVVTSNTSILDKLSSMLGFARGYKAVFETGDDSWNIPWVAYESGDNVDLSSITKDGRSLSFRSDDVAISPENTFTMPAKNVTINVTESPRSYTVTFPDGEYEITAVNGDTAPYIVPYDGSFRFRIASTAAGFDGRFDIYVNDVRLIAVNGVYTIPNIVGDVNVEIDVITDRFMVALPAELGFDLITTDSISVLRGGQFTFRISVDASSTGTPEVRVGDTILVPVAGLYTISNITEDVIITVTGITAEGTAGPDKEDDGATETPDSDEDKTGPNPDDNATGTSDQDDKAGADYGIYIPAAVVAAIAILSILMFLRGRQ